jgi:transposase InsO family protein
VADPDATLREWLRAWAKDHPRRGLRPAYHHARGEGWSVNHKKIQRLWREEGLRVPQRRRRKRLGTSTTPNLPVAEAPNKVGGRVPVRCHHRRTPGKDRLDRR